MNFYEDICFIFRLENDLLGWVERVEKKRKQTKMTKRRFHMEDSLPHLATWSRHRTELNRDLWYSITLLICYVY